MTGHARVTTPDADGFELLWWSPTLGPLHEHADGRIRDAQRHELAELPLDAFVLTPLHDFRAVAATLLRKLTPSVRAMLSGRASLAEVADLLDRACPDGAIGFPKVSMTRNLATQMAAAARVAYPDEVEVNVDQATGLARVVEIGRRHLARR